MKTEQREPTKSLEERTLDVLEALAPLDHMPGFPKEDKNLQFIARMLATFMETVEINHCDPEDPEWTGALGWVNPLLFTRDRIAQSFTFFPPPIKWRETYEHWFAGLDNIRASDLLDDVEG